MVVVHRSTLSILCPPLSEDYLSGEEAQFGVARVATHTGATAGCVVLGASAAASASAKTG